MHLNHPEAIPRPPAPALPPDPWKNCLPMVFLMPESLGISSKAKKVNAGWRSGWQGCRDESQRNGWGITLPQTSSSQRPQFLSFQIWIHLTSILCSQKKICTFGHELDSDHPTRQHVTGTIRKFLAYLKAEMLAVFALEYLFLKKKNKNFEMERPHCTWSLLQSELCTFLQFCREVV